MQINGIEIEDTFAEAFDMKASRVLITAETRELALTAARSATGLATSVIGCGCEAAVEEGACDLAGPDGRPAVSVLFFTVSGKMMGEQLVQRIGQCVMTAPTTACFDGLEGELPVVKVGAKLRYFGDGFQSSKLIGGRRFWRIPVLEGEFLVEDSIRLQPAVGGGNLLILADDAGQALAAAQATVAAIRKVPGVILPFPGGIVRSGSKVGSRYRFLGASTNHAYCPTLRGRVESSLPDDVQAVLEIVVDGLCIENVREAVRAGILGACRPGVRRISAGNYGGTLGRHRIMLHEILR